MFFKRARKDKAVEAAAPDAAANDTAPPAAAEAAPSAQNAEKVYGFSSTAELEPELGPIGQDKALAAIAFGLKMKGPGYNVFVSGLPGSGRRAGVKAEVRKRATGAPALCDWVYVRNFEDPSRPRALKLPAGRAKTFVAAIAAAFEELRFALPSALASEDIDSQRRLIEQEFRSERDAPIEALNQKAAAQNVAILRTPTGYVLAPMLEGRVVKAEVFGQLPEAMRQQVEMRVETLQRDLEKILSSADAHDKARRLRLAALNEEQARRVVDTAFADLRAAFADLPVVAQYVEDAAADMVRTVDEPALDARLQRYFVSALPASTEARDCAPVIEDATCTPSSLVGSAAHVPGMSGWCNAGLSVLSGALHRANGGYLLLDAHELAASPAAWAALKRCLKSREIAMEPRLSQDLALEADPIPLDVKVVLIGSPADHDQLRTADPEFVRLFQVRADFATELEGNETINKHYARLLAGLVKHYDLSAIDAGGVAAVLDEASAMTGDPSLLSLDIGCIANLLREANYWAGLASRDAVTREDVAKAIADRTSRSTR